MARCLVVGANGFLGAPLVDALVSEGHEVRAFDRFSRGTRSFESQAVDVRVGDFLNEAQLEDALAEQQYIFHFLSTTTPATADGDPLLDIRTNLSQTVLLLQHAVKAGAERVYFASSGGAIYGRQETEFCSEEMQLHPVSPYGIGKMAIESYLEYFTAKHGLESVALRISNPYGANQAPNRQQGLIPIALKAALEQTPIVRFGDGSMVRDYVSIDALMDQIVRLVRTKAAYRVYNLGSGVGHSVTEILNAVASVTRRQLLIEERPTPATFVERSVLDTTRFDAEFGRVEDVSIVEGIAHVWSRFTS